MAGPGGNITLTEADDHFPGIADDNSGNETIAALGGQDTVLGGLGDDVLDGGNGDDELFGDQGSDFLNGQDGTDRLEGGGGNDIIWDQLGSFTFIDAGAGNDNVQLGSVFNTGSVVNGGVGFDALQVAATITLQLIAISGFEELNTFGIIVTATADQFESFRLIRASGEGSGDPVHLALAGVGLPVLLNLASELNASGGRSGILVGSTDDENLVTGFSADVINSAKGDDTLSGGGGNDTLNGGNGDDRLIGGGGIDKLFGGAGQDTFVLLPTAANRDTIQNFVSAADTLEVSAAQFKGGLAAGTLADAQFVSNTTGLAGDLDDRFIFDTDDARLYYDINGSDAGGSRLIAVFGGVAPGLTASDIDVV